MIASRNCAREAATVTSRFERLTETRQVCLSYMPLNNELSFDSGRTLSVLIDASRDEPEVTEFTLPDMKRTRHLLINYDR